MEEKNIKSLERSVLAIHRKWLEDAKFHIIEGKKYEVSFQNTFMTLCFSFAPLFDRLSQNLTFDNLLMITSKDLLFPKLMKIKAPTIDVQAKGDTGFGQPRLQRRDLSKSKPIWVGAKEFCERFSAEHKAFVSLPNSNNWELMVRGHRGRIFPRGNSYQDDPGARCAPLQFCSAEERKVFRLVVWAPENILCSSF